jgi:hypothetical protein
MDPNALKDLHDIHLPSPIGWWPIAPGYLLLAMLIIFGVITLLLRYRYRRERSIKQEALRQLATLQHLQAETPNPSVTAAQLSLLLKQVALMYYPRETVASLQGDAWLNFLTQTSKRLDFKTVRYALLEMPFHPEATQPLDPLFPLVKAWIKQRRGRCLN